MQVDLRKYASFPLDNLRGLVLKGEIYKRPASLMPGVGISAANTK